MDFAAHVIDRKDVNTMITGYLIENTIIWKMRTPAIDCWKKPRIWDRFANDWCM